jgi:hypothetical protein
VLCEINLLGKLNKYQRKASNLRQATGGKFGKKKIINQTVDLSETEAEKPEYLSQEVFIFGGVRSFQYFNYRGPKTVVERAR